MATRHQRPHPARPQARQPPLHLPPARAARPKKIAEQTKATRVLVDHLLAEGFIDLDLAIDLVRHPVEDYVEAAIAATNASGKSLNHFQSLAYPVLELQRRLKNRSPYISLHRISEITDNGFDSKTIYTFTPPKLPASSKRWFALRVRRY